MKGIAGWDIERWRDEIGKQNIQIHIAEGEYDLVESADKWEKGVADNTKKKKKRKRRGKKKRKRKKNSFENSETAKMIAMSTNMFAPDLLLVKPARMETTFKKFVDDIFLRDEGK